jgi:hypothetical protein
LQHARWVETVWVLAFVLLAPGCGDREAIGEAPAAGVSGMATVAMARQQLASYGEGPAMSSDLLAASGSGVMQRLLTSRSARSAPWWWVPPTEGLGAELAPRASVATLGRPGFVEGAAGEVAGPAPPPEGWVVGYERNMWWRQLPETWSRRAGETVEERTGQAIGLAVTRPLGKKVEASFGYHRTLSDDFEADLDPGQSEQSLFLKLGWSF